jgi:hypothetical protein
MIALHQWRDNGPGLVMLGKFAHALCSTQRHKRGGFMKATAKPEG